ncbi:hemerythrin domain-containing protein [Massilia eurypsychrophila]|jgi:hemerythrin|nr:hemerythrin domain-containing protein [Massilia eurypsychrophila]
MNFNTTSWMARNIAGMMSEARLQMAARMERLARTPDDQFADGFNDLIAELETRLRDEEAVMEALNYPALRSHREQHARALAALHHAQPQVEGGDIALGHEALQLLPKWLLLHRSTMDLALASATRSPTPRSRRHSTAARTDSQDRRARYVRVQAQGEWERV